MKTCSSFLLIEKMLLKLFTSQKRLQRFFLSYLEFKSFTGAPSVHILHENIHTALALWKGIIYKLHLCVT